MKETNTYRMPHKELQRLAEILQVPKSNLSQILYGQRTISKNRSIRFSNMLKKFGYNFPPEWWMFSPTKIRQQIAEAHAKGER